jgi:prepilin-type N-terminal cleavage/methylation domain-containing protein
MIIYPPLTYFLSPQRGERTQLAKVIEILEEMKTYKSEQGFTLVEILIAIAILAFGLLAVATMQVRAIKTNAIASGISQGLTLGQAKVEELMNLSYGHSDLLDTDGDGTGQDIDEDGFDDDGGNFGLDDTTGADGSEDNGGRYKLYWNVAIDEPSTSSKTIRVIVTWTEKGRNKNIKLDFVKTDLS